MPQRHNCRNAVGRLGTSNTVAAALCMGLIHTIKSRLTQVVYPVLLLCNQDGQLESFMTTARRQIKLLEDRVKEIQKI